jgi:hypothetical protein
MKSFLNIIFLSLCVPSIFADGIDVFGVDDITQQKILKQFGSRVLINQKKIFDARSSGVSREKKNLEQAITQQFHLPAVRFENVYYPDHSFYTTIEVLPEPLEENTSYQYIPQKPYDLIDRMIIFKNEAIKLYFKQPELASDLQCLDFHCLVGEHSSLQSELEVFRKLVPQQQALIDKTLLEDNILERQRAAIFLLAYYPNHQLLLQRLETLLHQQNRLIIHDSLRVLGEYLKHYPKTSLDIKSISKFLSAYDLAVRHKALLVLEVLAHQRQYHEKLRKEAGYALYELLKLKQPNNHALAYQILCLISQKNDADTNLLAWKKWLEEKS